LKEEILRLKEVSTKEINRVKENSTKEINRVEKIVTDKQYLSLQVLKLKLNNRFTDVIELHIDNCSLLITLSECNFNDIFIKLLNKPSDYYNLDHQIKIVNELKKQHNGIDKSLLLEVLCILWVQPWTTCAWRGRISKATLLITMFQTHQLRRNRVV